MADRIITAEALITAKDGTGDVFEKIGAKLKNLSRTGKSSKALDDLTRGLDAAAKRYRALDALAGKMQGFAKSRRAFNDAKSALEAHARAMKASETPTKAMQREYERLQSTVSRAAAAFDKQKTSMIESKRAAEALGGSFKSIVGEQERIKSAVDQATQAIERQARAEKRAAAVGRVFHRVGHGLKHAVHEVSPLVMGGAGFETLEATKEATKAGAEIQHERALMNVAGIPDAEIDKADTQASQLAAKFPNVTHAQILENYREVRSVLQDKNETPEMMETLIKARSAMTAIDPSGHSADGLKYAIKGAELLGKAKNKEAFSGYLDGFIRAQQVMGTTANPEQLGDFAKYTRSAGMQLSDRFLHTTANSMIQEEKGSTAGKMVQQVVKEMTGGFEGYQSSAKQLVDLGLADDKDFKHDKLGNLHGLKPGKHIKDWRLWQSDPDRAVWEKLVPAMEAKGMSLEEQVATARRLFPNGLAADFVAKLILQRQSFENHSKLYGEAAGIDGGKKLGETDPLAAFGSLSKSLENFGATLTSPIMANAAGVMDSLAHSIGRWAQALSEWQKDHPEAGQAAAGGAVGGGLIVGGALGYGGLRGLGRLISGTAPEAATGGAEVAGAATGGAEVAGGLDVAAAAAAVAEGSAIAAAVAAAMPAAVAVALTSVMASYGFGTFDPEKFKDTPENRHATQNIGADVFGGSDGDDAPQPVYGPTRPKFGPPSPPTPSWWEWFKESILPSAHAEPVPPRPAISPYGGLEGARASFGLGDALKGPITAIVDKPVDVTGKVQLEGAATVSVSVKCAGGEVTNQTSSSSGNIKVSTGASMPGAAKAAAGSSK